MDFSEEWKSLWPISSVFSPPLLISDSAAAADSRHQPSSPTKSQETGPLIFNPCPKTLTQLISSPSLHSPLPSPFPYLSISRFIDTTSNSILQSTSSSIASTFGPQIWPTPLAQNCLQLLPCPNSSSSSVLAIYPTGENSDQVGCVLLSLRDDQIDAKVCKASKGLNHRIVKLLVNPVGDSALNPGNSCYTTFGYLLVCTMYSVYWYCVRVSGLGLDSELPGLDFLGSKLFKSCAIVHACWSPHLGEECVVLLESGELFLFDLDSCSTNPSLAKRFKGKKLRVLWNDLSFPEKCSWLSCEFTWHPRILTVAHSNAVFLVDLRSDGCNISCLLRIDKLVIGNPVENHRFVAISRAVSDNFHFVVASNHLLLLCDVRKPMMSVLQWAHDINNPCHINVVRLSELRSQAKNDKYNWASESGYCILMGSFWNNEFSVFCYGPNTRKSVSSEISKFCKSFYAWELPSELSLSARDCNCGSCLVREEFSKDALPQWIDWQQKKEIVLGFGILNKDLSVQLSEPEDFGGFTLIRLMSSGKLELQRYCALWEFVNFSEYAHKESSLLFEESRLYATGDGKDKFPKKFQYLKLDSLYGHLNDNLSQVLGAKMKKASDNPPEISSNSDFHQDICQKLKACGVTNLRSSPTVSNMLRDIGSPMSILEIAVMNIWAGLPTVLLRMGFVTYLELFNVLVNQKRVSLEFLDVPDQPHLPPFSSRNPSHRSSKWSRKFQHGDSFVGPVVPLHFLVTYNKLCLEDETDEISANVELELRCSKVMQVVSKVNLPDSPSDLHVDHAVSLADDRDDTCYNSQERDHFSLYEPIACSNKGGPTSESCTFGNVNYTTFIHRKCPKEIVSDDEIGMLRPEVLDAVCSTGLKFHDRPINVLPTEFKYFVRQQKRFQSSFNVNRSSLHKQK